MRPLGQGCTKGGSAVGARLERKNPKNPQGMLRVPRAAAVGCSEPCWHPQPVPERSLWDAQGLSCLSWPSPAPRPTVGSCCAPSPGSRPGLWRSLQLPQHLLLRQGAKSCSAGPWALPPPGQALRAAQQLARGRGVSVPSSPSSSAPCAPFRLRKCWFLWQARERKGTDTS